MNKISIQTLPLYILTKAIENKTTIGVIFPSIAELRVFANTLSTIAKEVISHSSYKITDAADMFKINIEKSEIYLLSSNPDYCRGKRLKEFVFVEPSKIPTEFRDAILAGYFLPGNDYVTLIYKELMVVSTNNAQ